ARWIEGNPDVDLGIAVRDARGRQAEARRHDARDRIDAAAEGDGLAHEAGIGTQTLPKRIGDDGERLARVAEPLPGLRVRADAVRQGRRDVDSVEELRLPGGREIVVSELDPAEYVEAPQALLVFRHVVQIQARHVFGI